MDLVVVESPNKCKKIAAYLGSGYRVVATVGHFRDLPKNGLSVDLKTMQPEYVVDPEKKDIVSRLKAEASRADKVLIATDPDREGEAIGWHVAHVLKLGARARRIVFHEITESALKKAVANPRDIDQHLVDAQQARRVLDRIVGYQVSPLLQELGKGLSAGRVQTATLHLVAQRERDRAAFRPVPYWLIEAKYANGLSAFYSDEKGKVIRVDSQARADELLALAREAEHRVFSVDRRETERRPFPPFTTSTLQQAASVRLGFGPERTMKLAQELFEGGHITYHRTDSVALSDEAVSIARGWISLHHPESLPDSPPRYRSKAGAQEAHEAIRPTSLGAPGDLSEDQKALYELIYKRFLSCQMKPARLSRTLVLIRATVSTKSESIFFTARGTEVLDPHWMLLEKPDEEHEQDGAGEGRGATPIEDDAEAAGPLPLVHEGEKLEPKGVESLSRETKPPPRFTEAGLIKEMERLGIGRPSTYAATIQTLYKRGYIEKEKKTVVATSLGLEVDSLMLEGIEKLTSPEYTAEMESRLDEIAEGRLGWVEYLQGWYAGFRPQLARASLIWGEKIAKIKTAGAISSGMEENLPVCPECGRAMRKLRGKSGEFLGCTGYPACRKTLPLPARAHGMKKPVADIPCPDCGRPMVERQGKSGKFLGCSGYPVCTRTAPIELTSSRQRKCPRCGSVLTRRQGPKGKFWGCLAYPKCRYTEDTVGSRKPSTKSSRK